MRTIKKIVVHCTATDDSLDIGFKEINEMHRLRGWLSPSGISCGYHFIIRRNGVVEAGRPVNEIGAHVEGHNKDSIGISWVGLKDISKEQKKSLLALVRGLAHQWGLDLVDDVFGHCEFDSGKKQGKTCPNISMVKFRAELVFDK